MDNRDSIFMGAAFHSYRGGLLLTDGQADPHDSPIAVFRFSKHHIQTSIVAAGGQKLKLCTEVSFGHSGE